jgi:drug/metabolite transporter (DMT)-like permease
VLTGLLFALAAMVGNAGAGLLQSAAANETGSRRPLALRPWYLVGLLVDALAWVCTVVALRHLPVFAVQAILGGAIALTAVASWALYGVRLRIRDRFSVAACVLGLATIAASAQGEAPAEFSALAILVLSSAVAALAVAAIAVWRLAAAWPLSLIAGLGFGGTSLAVRAVHLPAGVEVDVVALATQPATYLIGVFWVIGITTYSRALVIGNLSSVTAVFATTEVLAPGLVGIVLLGDEIRAGWWIPFGAGMVVAVVGVVVLAKAPVPQPGQRRRRRHVR